MKFSLLAILLLLTHLVKSQCSLRGVLLNYPQTEIYYYVDASSDLECKTLQELVKNKNMVLVWNGHTSNSKISGFGILDIFYIKNGGIQGLTSIYGYFINGYISGWSKETEFDSNYKIQSIEYIYTDNQGVEKDFEIDYATKNKLDNGEKNIIDNSIRYTNNYNLNKNKSNDIVAGALIIGSALFMVDAILGGNSEKIDSRKNYYNNNSSYSTNGLPNFITKSVRCICYGYADVKIISKYGTLQWDNIGTNTQNLTFGDDLLGIDGYIYRRGGNDTKESDFWYVGTVKDRIIKNSDGTYTIQF